MVHEQAHLHHLTPKFMDHILVQTEIIVVDKSPELLGAVGTSKEVMCTEMMAHPERGNNRVRIRGDSSTPRGPLLPVPHG